MLCVELHGISQEISNHSGTLTVLTLLAYGDPVDEGSEFCYRVASILIVDCGSIESSTGFFLTTVAGKC